MKGWEIILWALAIFSIINLFAPIINSIAEKQSQFTAIIVTGVIIYLLFKEFK